MKNLDKNIIYMSGTWDDSGIVIILDKQKIITVQITDNFFSNFKKRRFGIKIKLKNSLIKEQSDLVTLKTANENEPFSLLDNLSLLTMELETKRNDVRDIDEILVKIKSDEKLTPSLSIFTEEHWTRMRLAVA